MAACKSTQDANLDVHISAANLPLTCKLKNPPPGVAIDVVQCFIGATTIPITVTNGEFTIPDPKSNPPNQPNLAKGMSFDLQVHVSGQIPDGVVIHVVEDCDQASPIVDISDQVMRQAITTVEVE
jgi:hypothetical protein